MTDCNTYQRKYVIVTGMGRSGTNMVLDILDQHPNTFCRNEPNALKSGPITALEEGFFLQETKANFSQRWYDAIMETSQCNGGRDRFLASKKYFRSAAHAVIGQAIMSRSKLRRMVLPAERNDQWPCPAAYFDPPAQKAALPVLKILMCPGWITAAHPQVPAQHVLHIVRNPLGFVQSWWKRYVMRNPGGPEQVYADNRPSVRSIRQFYGKTEPLPDKFTLRNLVASELWRWRYVNERMQSTLAGSPRYMRLDYEMAVADRLETARKLYGFAGLDMPDKTLSRIAGMRNTLFAKHSPDGLDQDLIEDAIHEVMDDSRHTAVAYGTSGHHTRVHKAP